MRCDSTVLSSDIPDEKTQPRKCNVAQSKGTAVIVPMKYRRFYPFASLNTLSDWYPPGDLLSAAEALQKAFVDDPLMIYFVVSPYLYTSMRLRPFIRRIY